LKFVRTALLLAATLLTGGIARADLLNVSAPLSQDTISGVSATAAPVESADDFGLLAGDSVSEAFAVPLDSRLTGGAGVATNTIKAPPSSLSLFLSGLLTLGAFQITRSSKNLNFDQLPSWYHTGGPVQVGHATPLDLDFGNLSLRPFDVAFDGCEGSQVRFLRHRDQDSPPIAQCFLSSLTDPRGPPVL